MPSAPKLPDGMDDLAKPLTDADRIALASAALSILHLPSALQQQQYSNAVDRCWEMLAGEQFESDSAGYLIDEAHKVLNALSGLHPDRHQDVDWDRKEARAEVEKLVADALARRWALIVDEQTGQALLER